MQFEIIRNLFGFLFFPFSIIFIIVKTIIIVAIVIIVAVRVGDVIVRKICANILDVSKDSRFVPSLDAKLAQKTHTMICAPIIADGIVLGVIEAVNKNMPGMLCTPRSAGDNGSLGGSIHSPSSNTVSSSGSSHSSHSSVTFSANDALLLSFIAANAGLALSSLTSSANAPHHQILPAHVSVEMYHRPEPTLESIMKNATVRKLWNDSYERLQAERVSVFMYNPQSRALICSLSQDIEGLSVPCDKGFAGLCFNSRRIVNITDAPDDTRHNNEIDHRVGFRTKKLLCSPMLINEDSNIAIGVVQAINKRDGSSFSTQDEEAITAVSKTFVKIMAEQGLELEQFMEEGAAVYENVAVEAIPVQQVPSKGAAGVPRAVTSSPLPPQSQLQDFDVTFSRCISAMMLVSSMPEAVRELDRAIRTVTTCDFVGVYALGDDKLTRILPSAEPSMKASSVTEEEASANAALTLAGAKPPNASDKITSGGAGAGVGAAAHAGEAIRMCNLPIQMKQALQFSTVAEFALPEGGHSKGGHPQYLLPDIPVQQALIVPIEAKIPGSPEPGSGLLVIGKTSRLGATVVSMRAAIEAICDNFSSAVLNLSQQLDRCNYTQKLQSHFHLLNNTLAALRDFVVLLNSEGKFMASNKSLEELLGGPHYKNGGKPGTPPPQMNGAHPIMPPVAVTEGSHYTKWLTQGNSPELMRDIASVLSTGTARCLDKVKLFTAVHPDGLLVDYQVIPIENPDININININSNHSNSSNSSNSSSNGNSGTDMNSSLCKDSSYTPFGAVPKLNRTMRGDSSLDKLPVALEGHDGLCKFSVLLVIHTENFHHQRALGPAASPYMNLASLANLPLNMLDTESAHGVVDAATTIVNSVRNSYSLSEELEETLKSITHSLSNASRKLSIMETTRTSMSHALLSNKIALVTNAEILSPDLFEWEFNVLAITDGLHLCNIMGKLFESICNLDDLGIDKFTLARYIAEVGKNYHDRPFHNLQHATCVTHFTYKLITATKAEQNLSKYQVFAIMISAVVHDVDHPGNTNLFEVNSASELALRYNDQAVLENHHCSTAFRLMRKANTQVLATLPQRTVAEIRKTIISSVMATDMAVHFDLIEETKRKAELGWKFDEERDRFFLGKILLHAADLSNPVRPYHMTKEWARRISMEFNDQVTREKALGMPVLGFMETPDEKAFCKNEIGFASFVVAPMWRALALVYPALDFLVAQLDANVDVWKESLKALEEPKSEPSSSNSNSSSEEKRSPQKS